MIAAVSPSKLSYNDTHNTLKYAEQDMKIKQQAKKRPQRQRTQADVQITYRGVQGKRRKAFSASSTRSRTRSPSSRPRSSSSNRASRQSNKMPCCKCHTLTPAAQPRLRITLLCQRRWSCLRTSRRLSPATTAGRPTALMRREISKLCERRSLGRSVKTRPSFGPVL
ncbi:hypothetical protein MRX96_007629 [Rhipicephalus microplus]